MSMNNDFEKEAVLLEETYSATLKEVKEYERDFGEGPVQKLAWLFEINASEDDLDEDVEYEAEFNGTIEVAAHTSFATGRNSKFTQIGLARFAGEEWDGDTDSLIGNACLLDVVQYKTQSGEVRNGVDRVKPPKKAKAAAKGKASKAEEEEEADFEKIPF